MTSTPDIVRADHLAIRVADFATDGVDVSPQRVLRCVPHRGGEPLGFGLQPGRIGDAGSALDHVEEAGVAFPCSSRVRSTIPVTSPRGASPRRSCLRR